MSGPIIQGPIIQGWCPGALRPMESGDGWVVRVRPRAGRLTQAQAGGIADLARLYGNGLIDLSARANVQLRGVSRQTHAPLIDGLRALNLLDETAQAEAQRNVTLAPFWSQGDGALDLALELSAALAAAPRLPGKFGFALDMGAAPVLRDTAADIRIERAAGGAIVYGAGAQTGAAVPMAQAAQAALNLAQWFIDAGGIGPDGRGRMARLLQSGAALPAQFTAQPVPYAAPFAPRLGLHPSGALVGFEFGQMQAETLAALAALGPLRVTPWRMLLIEGAQAMPAIPSVLTDPNDPMLRIIACTGAPACIQGHAPTRDLARALAPHIAQGQLCHVSGCAKGCAHPQRADITLTATPHGFDLVRSGSAGDTPRQTALTPSQIIQALHAP
jgi:precorrin-3B synthase